jgi:predicted aspartyl protease
MRIGALALLLAITACASANSAGRAEIPFRYVHNEILIDTRVGGQGPYTFLLDTGVTPSGVDTALAPALGIPLEEENSGAAEGVGSDDVTAYAAVLRNVEIAGRRYGDIEAAAIPMAGLSSRLGEPLHGILGESFLRGKVVTIDYRRRLVTIGGAAPDPSDPGVYQFPMVTAPDDIMPLMQVSIGGRSLTASMDTGSSGGLEVFASAIADAGLVETTANWEVSSSVGARGRRETRRGMWPPVTIGPFELHDVPGTVGPRENERHRQANVGNAVFERFVVTFDYANRTVTLQRNE